LHSIYLITCSKEKGQKKAPAKDLYKSERFKYSRNLAEVYADQWFILSAKHGLLKPSDLITPYETCLHELDTTTRHKWYKMVINQLTPYLNTDSQVVYIGDEEYAQEISLFLSEKNIPLFMPFRHLMEENRILWLKQVQPSSHRMREVTKLYSMLNNPELLKKQLKNIRQIKDSRTLPHRGLYIFYLPQDRRMFSPSNLRIVRVGTHAVSAGSSSSLWQRLKTHKGKEDGTGNHRASIFRLHIGTALIERDNLDCPSWAIGNSTNSELMEKEMEIERKVSDYIGRMSVLCLLIDDPPSKISDRAYLEQNIIALLSGSIGPVDFADESWLGYYCTNHAVRRSALWNVDHTDKEYDPEFFQVLQTYVDISAGRSISINRSIAPKFWYRNARYSYRQKSLSFD
jgi:hypothetical protein